MGRTTGGVTGPERWATPEAAAALCLRWRYSGQSLRTWPGSPHWKQRRSFSSRSSSFTSSSLSFSFFLTLPHKQKVG